jgi:hypothetical protein
VPRPASEATEPLPATEPPAKPGSGPGGGSPASEHHPGLTPRRLLAALTVLAAIALALILVSGAGDEGSPSDAGQPGQPTEPPAAVGEQATEAAPTPPAAEPDSEGAPAVSCSAIEEEKKALEEEKKAAEERAGDDKQAKEAIKTQFEAEKKTLEQRAERRNRR